jgi:nucleoside 2-deoxyribosyltransferase
MAQVRIEGLWPDDEHIPGTGNGVCFRMASGRQYLVSSSLLATQPDLLREAVVPFTRYIDEHPEENPVVFTTHNVEQILSRPPLPFSERARLLALKVVVLLGHRPGELRVQRSPHVPLYLDLLRSSYLSSAHELAAILDYWADEGVFALQKYADGKIDVTLTVRGLIALEEDISAAARDTAFVAMWFSPEVSVAYDKGIAPAVEELGYRPVRIDRQEHNNKIDDEIVAAIRRARFVIADFSCGPDGGRGGVYYEAGFAAGLGIPVIHMVRESDVGALHFDTRQINHIVWVDPADLRRKLANRIGATLGACK